VYALSKLAGEHLLDLFSRMHGYEFVCLRLFNVYGPGQNPHHPYANVTCKFSRAAALGLGVNLFGDGEQTRDFVFVDDVVRVLLEVGFRPMNHRVYNVGTGRQFSVNHLLESVQRLSGARIQVDREAEWPNDTRAIQSDVERLRGEIG